ncbi:hypothetical protein MMC26_000835 [Xylographa opegraphella]|nr:hypothetical protein [Xylographa opegraphella]
MKCSLTIAFSLLAIISPSSALAQDFLQEIDQGNGVFGVGVAAPAAPAAPVNAPVVAPAPAPPAPAPVPPPVTSAMPAPTPLIALALPASSSTTTTTTPSPVVAASPTTLIPIATGIKPVNEAIVTSSPPVAKAPVPYTGFVDGCTSVNTRYLTIHVTNAWTTPLTAFLGSNYGAPTPVNNPAPTVLAPSAATSYVFPPCWAGRISLDPSSDSNPYASKIEGSVGSNETTELDLDVSYVDGYTVPITCSSGNTVVVGCNIDLFAHGECGTDKEVLDDNGTGCQNPMNDPVGNGPPTKFFAPCAGAAYTYPNDNDANNGSVDDTVSCCIGTNCKPSNKQGLAKGSKRDMAASLQRATFLLNREASGTDIMAKSPNVAARSPEAGAGAHLRSHKHRHGLKKRHAHHVS